MENYQNLHSTHLPTIFFLKKDLPAKLGQVKLIFLKIISYNKDDCGI